MRVRTRLSVQLSDEDATLAPDTIPGLHKKAPCLATGRSLLLYLFSAYQALDPWHPGEPQVLVVALKFKLLTTLFTLFMCVAEFTAVVL